MKKLFIAIGLIVLIGAGCSQVEVKPVVTNPSVSQPDFFEKKLKCADLADKMTETYAASGEGNFVIIAELFYSPVEDSCLVNVWNWYKELPDSFNLFDGLSGRLIESVEEGDADARALRIRNDEMVQRYK